MNETTESYSSKKGRWTREEQNLFKIAYNWYGNDWKKLSEIITTRNIIQIRSHAQKYCKNFKKKETNQSESQKIYILDNETLESLNQYISNSCATSYKNYIELQQSMIYSQASSMEYEIKTPEFSVKVELSHS